MNIGDMVCSADVERINALVGGGYCAIVSLSDPEPDPNPSDDKSDKNNKKSK